ncbi:MAG: hypothetical protein ACREEC_13760 [Thermoplasmata archaeon]
MFEFGDQIHSAFREAVESGALEGGEDILARIRNLDTPAEERDHLWTRLLTSYVAGPRQPWATAILEALRFDLVAVAAGAQIFTSTVGRDDIAQHLVAEVLSAAVDGPADPARWTPNRLVTRATTALYRWLEEEAQPSAADATVITVARGRAQVARFELAEVAADLEAGRHPREEMKLLARRHFVGMSHADLAAESGGSVEASRKRQQRCTARVRSHLAAA